MTDATIADTVVLGYNDRAAVRAAFASFGDEIAAVITEAAPGNMGVVPPGIEEGVGFNAFLAAIARAQRRFVHLRRGDDRLSGESIRTVRA